MLDLPDHGELWSQPWKFEFQENRIKTVTHGSVLPYKFSRQISLNRSQLIFEYEIVNTSQKTFLGFWTLHALFRAESGMKLKVSGNPSMTKEFGFSSRMGEDGENGYTGHLDKYIWPTTLGPNGEIHDLSEIDLQRPLTDKVVLRTPLDGEVRLINEGAGRSLKFRVLPSEIPYFGICYNLGAWPFTGEKTTWVAIEPSQGATDDLDESSRLGAAIKFLPKQPVCFSFTLTLD